MSSFQSRSSYQRFVVVSFLGTALWATPVLAQTTSPKTPTGEAAGQATPAEDRRPLSPAQIALFETPHLQNVRQTSTLDYELVQNGPAGFKDKVAMHVRAIHPDGSKDLTFDFLSGERRIAYPGLDQFQGNPLLMLILERDVNEMKQTLGLSAVYFRNRIRQAFVDQAILSDTHIDYDGHSVPARVVTVQPFAHDERLDHLPTVQQKSYTFVLADAVPGSIAEMRIDMPADPATQLPPYSERITFQGTEP